jgi:hypothetical protein
MYFMNYDEAEEPGLPDFLGSIYQKVTIYPQNIPKCHKIYQMAGKLTKWPYKIVKIPESSNARPFKIYPNWYFWFENKPSGNPAEDSS